MAGDWIKMRGNLWDDPRVSRLVDLTDSSEAAVVGALYWLWATADQHSEDGVMIGLSRKQIDRKTGVPGFGDALLSIGWIADHPEGVRIVRFEEHNGKSAKKRCQTAIRVANYKTGNAEVTHVALPSESCSVTSALPRVREEKSKQPISESNVIGAPEAFAPQSAENATRKGELCKKIRALGVQAAPHMTAWADLLPHYSDDEIIAVAEIAREKKPGDRISLAYLIPMLKDKGSTAKRAPDAGPAWWSNDALIIQEGQRIGVSPRPGESMSEFKGRVSIKRTEAAAA